MEIKDIATDRVIPYARNPRRNDAAVAAVAASIREFGFRQPIVVDEDMTVLVGHTRLKAAQSLGLAKVPVHVAKGLTESQRKAYRIADNKLNDLAAWDDEMLALELVDLQNESYDLTLTGFDPAELAKMLNPPTILEGADLDEVPSPPKVAITKPGDLITLGRHRLLCGDSRDFGTVEKLIDGRKINVAFTSPPYASQRKYDESSGFKPIKPDEYVDWFRDVASNIMAVSADDGSYFLNIKEHCDDGQRSLYVKDLTIAHVREWGWRFVDELVWKRNGVPGKWGNRFKNQWEPIFHYCRNAQIKMRHEAVMHESDGAFNYSPDNPKSKTGFFSSRGRSDICKEGMALPGNVLKIETELMQTENHSAPFPVALPTFFINAFSDAGDAIYDPFMGSGSTLIAAEKTGRNGYGIEISPAYCDVIVTRWETATGQKAVRP